MKTEQTKLASGGSAAKAVVLGVSVATATMLIGYEFDAGNASSRVLFAPAGSSSEDHKPTGESLIRSEFRALVKKWEKETMPHSSLGDVFLNDAYQRIMAMGRDALPMILEDLQKKPRHWFYALEKIVGHDVAVGSKSFGEARKAWLEWGRKLKYI